MDSCASEWYVISKGITSFLVTFQAESWRKTLLSAEVSVRKNLKTSWSAAMWNQAKWVYVWKLGVHVVVPSHWSAFTYIPPSTCSPSVETRLSKCASLYLSIVVVGNSYSQRRCLALRLIDRLKQGGWSKKKCNFDWSKLQFFFKILSSSPRTAW